MEGMFDVCLCTHPQDVIEQTSFRMIRWIFVFSLSDDSEYIQIEVQL